MSRSDVGRGTRRLLRRILVAMGAFVEAGVIRGCLNPATEDRAHGGQGGIMPAC
jgi:hypothetical protein